MVRTHAGKNCIHTILSKTFAYIYMLDQFKNGYRFLSNAFHFRIYSDERISQVKGIHQIPKMYLCGFCLQFQDETNTAMYQFVSSRPHSVMNWAQAIYIHSALLQLGIALYILG